MARLGIVLYHGTESGPISAHRQWASQAEASFLWQARFKPVEESSARLYV